MERPQRLATIHVRDVFIMSLDCKRLDTDAVPFVLAFVEECIEAGARTLVLEFGPRTAVDFIGARFLKTLSEHFGGPERLRVCGMSPRARAFLRSTRVLEHVGLYESWSEAIERAA